MFFNSFAMVERNSVVFLKSMFMSVGPAAEELGKLYRTNQAASDNPRHWNMIRLT